LKVEVGLEVEVEGARGEVEEGATGVIQHTYPGMCISSRLFVTVLE
jgi:hypothetical protein